jgi:hypothetical protein
MAQAILAEEPVLSESRQNKNADTLMALAILAEKPLLSETRQADTLMAWHPKKTCDRLTPLAIIADNVKLTRWRASPMDVKEVSGVKAAQTPLLDAATDQTWRLLYETITKTKPTSHNSTR